MKVLYFGDVFGKPGRNAVKVAMRKISASHRPDFIVMNGENMAHGKGLLPDQVDEFLKLGVDVITTGNHVWDQAVIAETLNREERVLRPLNFPNEEPMRAPGHGAVIVSSRKDPNLKLAVLHSMGRVFMDALDCPFRLTLKEVERVRGLGVKSIFVDFHGEATSEKQAFAHFLDGRVSAVVGSHSHVQTADERLLPGGTAAITDVGMCGCFDSVIGVKKEVSIQRFLSKRPVRFEPAEGPGGYGAVLVDIDTSSGKANSILRFRETVATE